MKSCDENGYVKMAESGGGRDEFLVKVVQGLIKGLHRFW